MVTSLEYLAQLIAGIEPIFTDCVTAPKVLEDG
jgi:hypothetical protein